MQAQKEKNFRFSYTVFTVTAQMTSEALHVQMGIRQINVRLDRLKHLFVDERSGRESVELILSYMTKSGALKRARIFSDHGESGLNALVEALLECRPEIDIRHLPVNDAYERMGSKSMTWYALPLLMSAALLLVGIICTPLIIHGLDTQRSEIGLSKVDHPQDTRTLRITGGRLEQSLAVNDAREGVVDERTNVWIPLVSPSWTPKEDVRVIVQVLASDLDSLTQEKHVEGILRNVWWEGLRSSQRKRLTESGLRLAPEVSLIDSRATPRDDLGLALLILVTLGMIVGGVTLALYMQHRGRPTT